MQELLRSAHDLGLKPDSVRYSRASFLFPKKQPPLYRSFENESGYLRRCFPGLVSTAHVLGDPSHGLQWHVFSATQAPKFQPTSDSVTYSTPLYPSGIESRSDTMEMCCGTQELSAGAEDEEGRKDENGTCTLELCMTELDEGAAQQFVRTESFISSCHTTSATGISCLVPSAEIDDYVFEPCGCAFVIWMHAIGCRRLNALTVCTFQFEVDR
jgi:hypothetical protein